MVRVSFVSVLLLFNDTNSGVEGVNQEEGRGSKHQPHSLSHYKRNAGRP